MKILFVSLGCDKNLVDTEYMLGILGNEGYAFTDDEQEADIIVINTCCFINDAKEESINTILEMAEYRESGNCKALIVTGCLAQRYQEEIEKEIPQVDAILGTNSYDAIAEAVKNVLGGSHYENFKTLEGLPAVSAKRSLTTGGHYAHLKIAEGCNKHCTYCIIPKIRGEYRSIPIEELVESARELAAQGVKELILVAQETTLYGIDLYGEKSLYRLLDELNKIEGIYWIRILYCYPEEIDDKLIASIKRNEKVCHYLDLPIQHADDIILKRMGRRTSQADLRSIVTKLRSDIPDIALRTTLICGFPGETEKEHESLMYFINEMEFDRLGVFTYSPEENTPAAEFPNQIPDDIKQTRLDEIMKLQQNIAFEMAEAKTGQCLDVIIEGELTSDNVYVARTMADAPKIDGCVFIPITEKYMSGDIVRVEITGALGYDLLAVPAL